MKKGFEIYLQRYRWFFLLGIVLLSIGLFFGLQTFQTTAPVHYSGWLTGIMPVSKENPNDSVLVAYDPVHNVTEDILKLENYTANNYGAVSPDGRYAAYTQWKTDRNRYLVVRSLKEETTREYFRDVEDPFDVLYVSWLSDGRSLLFVTNDLKNSYGYQMIRMLDSETGEIRDLVQGGHWYVPANMASTDEWRTGKSLQSQLELDELIKRHGGSSVPLKRVGARLYVKISAPMVSPDGKRIVYSMTLCRDSAFEGEKLFLGSGIWVLDLEKGASQRIYTMDGKDGAIGRVTWVPGSEKVAFLRYRDFNGTDGQIDTMDLDSRQVRTLLPTSAEHFTNLELIGLPGQQVSFISIAKGEPDTAKRYLVDTRTGEIKRQQVDIHGWDTFWRFSLLY